MPPKKKKEPKNAYYFFMQDWRKRKEAEGQRFSLKEVSQFCNEDWNNLPERDRIRYKEMEKEAKNKDKTDLSNKYNALGTTFEALDKEEREKKEAAALMENCIVSTMAAISTSRDSLMNHIFYLVHANVYCYWGQQQIYIPCEVAISKFSLKEGVMATYHVFPEPCTENGKIPLGYRFQVKQNSDSVHGIPDPSEFDQVETDWRKIRSDVHNFLRPNGGEEIPPVYTMDMDDTNNNCHISAVRTFFDFVAGDSYDKFRVYSLTRLFFKLYGACQQVALREFQDHDLAFPVEGNAHTQLLRDVYNFSPGLACEFHEEADFYQNCSTSFVKRWVFLICEFCCPALRIEMIRGRHCIAKAKLDIPWLSGSPKTAPASCSNNVVTSLVDDDDDDSDSDDDEGWSTVTVPRVQHGTIRNGDRAKTTADRIQEGIKNLKVAHEDDKPLIVKPPQQARVFKTGQSPHVVSEIKENNAPPPSVRLPTSRGRGEMLTLALSQHLQSAPGASFSSEDFPPIGAAARPGQVSQPSGSGWGRGFTM